MTIQEAKQLGLAHGKGLAENNATIDDAFDAIDHFRSFTPFEFYAKEFNEDESGEKWEAYEEGQNQAIEEHFASKADEDEGTEGQDRKG